MEMSKIEENIRQRDISNYVYEFIAETIEAEKFEDTERFVRVLIELLESRHLKKASERGEAMSDEEARKFERHQMPYGKYKGDLISGVPLGRLSWYADQTFIDDLRRYLKSNRVKVERDKEDGD